jgi:AcrR family transcriptional regulator
MHAARKGGREMSTPGPPTKERILDAARRCLLEEGYARLSTRRVAAEADMPLSQIHYHFGGKDGMVLALLEREDRQLIARQRRMYGEEAPLWKRYEQACDYLEDDLESGYVRVLQELLAAGWSQPGVAAAVLRILGGWFDVLEGVCREAESRFGPLGPLTPRGLGMLIGLAFLGGEQLVLLGDPSWRTEVLETLRSLADVIRTFEKGPS